ncbi:hypothetical protein C8J57DRAFT_759897 [Mycena rebaudengoi]|nr:hypothetical protein C8J57DRAFT_759897 [Mycena rebaudengoi]
MITLANQMTKMSGHKLSKMRVRKQVYDLCATIARVNGWVDVVVAALAFGDLSGYAQLENVSWIYAALEDVHQSNVNAENDWDAAMEERVCCLLKALNDAREFPVPSEKALQVILKALSREDPRSIPAVKLLCQEKYWFGDINLQPIMQEHNVWSQMGSVIMRNSSQISNHSLKQYILLGEKLSNLIQWTQYIRRNLSHWITIYYKRPIFSEEHLRAPYLSVLEHIWGVKYTGTFHFMKDTEKTFAWTLIALSIGWEDFNFSERQTLQEFYYLIRCTISTAFKSHNSYGRYYFDISPEFRAAFYTPLGSSLIQAAINAEDMVPGGPTQSDNQDGSLREKTQMSQVLQQATRILDEMGQVLKHESEGEQVDHGEEKARRYWNNLRTHFEEQVDQLEESLKETLGTAEISP